MAETGIQLDRRQLMHGSATIALASSFGLTACGRNLPVLALDGRVVTRDAPEFEQWRTGVIWQSRKPDRKPSLIVRPNSTAAIAAAVQYARANDLKISVKSSGHHIWGNFLRDDGMLIDMWNFRKVELVDDGLAAWIEPSVWSRDIMLELAKGGRAFPAAHCASVGMGGFLLGGGVGLNWDNWGGLSAYSILAAEVVTADGKIKVIDDRNEPDLAWALRGAGNGFPAIVTRFKVKTYPLPKYLKASTFFFPIAETPAALAWVESLSKSGKLSNCEPLIILGHNPGAPPGTPNEQAKVCIVRFNLFVDNAAAATAQLDAIGADPFVAKAGFMKPALATNGSAPIASSWAVAAAALSTKRLKRTMQTFACSLGVPGGAPGLWPRMISGSQLLSLPDLERLSTQANAAGVSAIGKKKVLAFRYFGNG